jgi:hypothetical protein
MYEAFAKGVIYERMAHGGVYYTAQQMQEMAPMIAQMVDGHSELELHEVKSEMSSILLGGEIENLAAAEIWGYLVACEQFYAHPSEGEDDYNELADRFYHMAGLE